MSAMCSASEMHDSLPLQEEDDEETAHHRFHSDAKAIVVPSSDSDSKILTENCVTEINDLRLVNIVLQLAPIQSQSATVQLY